MLLSVPLSYDLPVKQCERIVTQFPDLCFQFLECRGLNVENRGICGSTYELNLRAVFFDKGFICFGDHYFHCRMFQIRLQIYNKFLTLPNLLQFIFIKKGEPPSNIGLSGVRVNHKTASLQYKSDQKAYNHSNDHYQCITFSTFLAPQSLVISLCRVHMAYFLALIPLIASNISLGCLF